MYLLIQFNWSAIGAIAAIIAAIAACVYTYYTFQLLSANIRSIEKNNKLIEFQIYSKMSETIFTDKSETLYQTIVENNFYIEEIKNAQSKGTGISGRDVSKYLLFPIEDMCKYYKDGLISASSIDYGFGNHILVVGSCEQIFLYIKYLRENVYSNSNTFSGFQEIFAQVYSNISTSEKTKFNNHFT